jgi:hypothetical protein
MKTGEGGNQNKLELKELAVKLAFLGKPTRIYGI